jgi:hypothetical protein
MYTAENLPRERLAHIRLHAAVDGLHSAENKRDKILQNSLTLNRTGVDSHSFFDICWFVRLVVRPGLKPWSPSQTMRLAGHRGVRSLTCSAPASAAEFQRPQTFGTQQPAASWLRVPPQSGTRVWPQTRSTKRARKHGIATEGRRGSIATRWWRRTNRMFQRQDRFPRR